VPVTPNFLKASSAELCKQALLAFPEVVLPLVTKFSDKVPPNEF
jgi:hypothetical protein